MSKRDPFERLGDLVDQPVAPDARFAADLKSQLMSGLSVSGRNRSWEEEHQPVDITFRPSPVVLPHVQRRRFKPIVLLEIAAVAALLIGIAAAIASGMFSSDPDGQPTNPAAALQDDSAATPEPGMEPIVVPPAGTMEPTLAPPAGILWQVSLPEGESLDFGGMTVHNGMIYRLLATPSFVGIEAVDSATGGVLWKTTQSWSGFGIAADDDRVYFLSGPDENGNSAVNAVSAATGEDLWQREVTEFLTGLTLADGTLYAIDDADTVLAIDPADGAIQWGSFIDPMGPTERATSDRTLAYLELAIGESVLVGLSSTGVLTAIDRESGEEVWHMDGFDALNTRLQIAGDVLVVFTQQPGALDTGTPLAVTTGATPEAESVPNAEVSATASAWRQMGVSLVGESNGSTLWEQDIVGPVVQTSAIGDTVAYIVLQDETGDAGTAVTPPQSVLYGLAASSGEVVWSTSSGNTTFTRLGRWIPTEGWQELFIVAADDGSLTVVDPHQQGRIKGVEIDLEQTVISEPQGDQNGLYLTLLDGTLVSLSSTTVIDGQ
jgi:outer membrane protein assembly factor BamB